MRVLVTGANGFLGSHLVRLFIDKQHQVIAGHREGADLSKINSSDCTFQVLNYNNVQALTEKFSELWEQFGTHDIVIHNAALTHSIKSKKFYDVNVGLTRNLCEALKESQLLSENGKVVLISSMAALGPVSYEGPVSHYGKSKLQAEEVLKSYPFDYLIFRPTAIYGPGDSSFRPLFKSVRLKLYPRFNPSSQKVTMIHAEDVARNVERLSTTAKNLTVHLDDGNVYSHKQISAVTGETVGRKPIVIPIPQFLARSIFGFITFFCNLLNITPPITSEKYFEISKDWDHDFSAERTQHPLLIKYSLLEGFNETYLYYKSNKLL